MPFMPVQVHTTKSVLLFFFQIQHQHKRCFGELFSYPHRHIGHPPGNFFDPQMVYFCTIISSVGAHQVFGLMQVLGNVSEFQRAVKLVIETVSFDKDSTVQVFEANIRYQARFWTCT